MPVFVLLLIAAAPPGPLPAGELVHVEVGTLPVILSAPHGGRSAVPGVPPRTGPAVPEGGRSDRFTTVRDANTDRLALAVADALQARTGRRPGLVVARFDRRYIDANRPAAEGVEHPLARPAYDLYHDSLARGVRRVRERHGGGLLLDLHGQAAEPAAVFRGTRDGRTTRRGGTGRPIPLRLADALRAGGLTVLPAGDGRETRYTGGHIVWTYGRHRPDGINAVQLEFGRDLRRADAIETTAAAVADAVVALGLSGMPADRVGP